MALNKVAVRLGTEGKEEVIRDFREYGEAGDAAAQRVARAFDRASQDMESAERRKAAAAQKIAAIMPQTATQMRINDAVGTGSSLSEGSARVSASAFRELYQEQERLTAGAAALRAQIDPAWAAQQRFNNEMAQARALIAADVITLDEYCAKLRIEQGLLDEVSNSQKGVGASSGAIRAGMQQLGFQAQDFAVQVAGGTSAVRAFAMQAPQAIGALQLMSTGAEQGKGKFAAFASFLGGPWGIALGVAIPVGAMLVEKLFGMGEAATDASGKLNKHKVVVETLAGAYDTLAASMNKAGAKAIEAQGMAMVKLKQDEANVGRLRTEAERAAAALAASQRVDPRGRGSAPLVRDAAAAQANLKAAEQDLQTSRNLINLFDKRRQETAARSSGIATGGGSTGVSRTGSVRPSAGTALIPDTLYDTNGRWARNQAAGDAAKEALDKEYDAIRERQKSFAAANDDISAGNILLNLEWELRGKSRREIEAAVELRRYQLDLQRDGRDLTAEQVAELVRAKAAQIGFTQAVDDSNAKLTALRDIGSNVVDSVLNPSNWTSWKNVALGAINDVVSAMWKMAVINPIQNRISGSDLPTLGSLFGLFGKKPETTGGSAIGNLFTPAGAMLVGENGPEIVNMPRGARVMTASDTRRALGSNDNGLEVRVIKGDLFDVEVRQISAGVSADVVGAAAPIIATGASNGAQQAVARRSGRRLA